MACDTESEKGERKMEIGLVKVEEEKRNEKNC